MNRENAFWKDPLDPAEIIPIKEKIKTNHIFDRHVFFIFIIMLMLFFMSSRHSE